MTSKSAHLSISHKITMIQLLTCLPLIFYDYTLRRFFFLSEPHTYLFSYYYFICKAPQGEMLATMKDIFSPEISDFKSSATTPNCAASRFLFRGYPIQRGKMVIGTRIAFVH